MMDEASKIEELENKLDEALAKVFELEKQQKQDGMIRYELEEMIRNIYRECRNILKSEEEAPSLENVLENLSENIRRMTRDYNIQL